MRATPGKIKVATLSQGGVRHYSDVFSAMAALRRALTGVQCLMFRKKDLRPATQTRGQRWMTDLIPLQQQGRTIKDGIGPMEKMGLPSKCCLTHFRHQSSVKGSVRT